MSENRDIIAVHGWREQDHSTIDGYVYCRCGWSARRVAGLSEREQHADHVLAVLEDPYSSTSQQAEAWRRVVQHPEIGTPGRLARSGYGGSYADMVCARITDLADRPSEPTYEDLGDLATDRGVKAVVGWAVAGVLAGVVIWQKRRR